MSCPLVGLFARLVRAARTPANNMAATMAAMNNRISGFFFTVTSTSELNTVNKDRHPERSENLHLAANCRSLASLGMTVQEKQISG